MNGVVFVEQRPMEGREVEAIAGAVIGREGTDIVVPDPEVSRRHAAIRQHGAGLAIEDLGSTNGTYVNHTRLTGLHVLGDGDTVRLGNTEWRVRATQGAAGTQIGRAPESAMPVAAPAPAPAPAPPVPAAAPAAPAPATTAMPVMPAPPQAPAQPAAPSPAGVGPRGDVPAPPEVAPSAIRRVLPPPGAAGAPAFTPPGGRHITTKSGSAATRVEATILCLLFAIAVAVAVVVYFATR